MIDRRWLVAVACVALLLAGVDAFRKLPIEPYPNVSPLNVQVITQWAGHSTLEVEQQLTIPIETALAGLPDVKAFRSISLFGLSVVTVQFQDGVGSFVARNNVQQYLQNANLPTGVNPSLSPDADALGEVMRYRIDAPGWDPTSVKTLQDWTLYKAIKTVPGIADVTAFGGRVKQYQVIPDSGRLQLYNVTLNQLFSAVQNGNGNAGGDVLNTGSQRVVVRGVGMLRTLDDVKNIVITTNNGVPVHVGDVAEVTTGFAPRLGQVTQNESDDIVEAIVLMRRGGNASEVLAKVRERVNDLNVSGSLPPGVKVSPFYDRQHLLDLTVETVQHTLVVGMALVLMVLYAFLANFRGALIVAMVIPLGLCAAFIGMTQVGIPANLISLGAVDFGLIVDAAVIVIENIIRIIEEKKFDSIKAAIVAAVAEVQRPVIFSTGIIIVAYSPLFILGGVEGKIFHPMGMTMGVALLASIVLALTLVPAMASFAYKNDSHLSEPTYFVRLLEGYRSLTGCLLDRPKVVLGAALTAFGLAVFLLTRLGTSFLPTLEENNLWIRVTLPTTVEMDYSLKVSRQLRELFRSQPEVKNVTVQVGRPDDGTDATGVFNQEYSLAFKEPSQWPVGVTREDVVRRLQSQLNTIPGVDFSFSQYIQDNVAEALSGVKGENSVKIFGDDLGRLTEVADRIERVLDSTPGVVDAGVLRALGQPTLNIVIDRAACARFGVNVSDLQNVISNAIGGGVATTVLEGERRVDLTVRLPLRERASVELLGNLKVDAPDGSRIPLSMLARIEQANGPFFVYREGALRYMAVKFGIRDRDLGSTVAEVQARIAKEVPLPRGYTLKWAGQFDQMKVAQQKLSVIIPATLGVIFLLLFFAFGNLRDAGLVLVNVPFAAIGGIAALYITGEDLSISAAIGFLSLFGIAIQDGVILISYIRKLLDEHVRLTGLLTRDVLRQAVLDGAALRMRPVLMTALLAGLGLLPAAMSHAIGSQAQRPLALVIVGGMLTTTLLTLLVLPVIYLVVSSRKLPV
ncbi:MAG: efflux RND transporter permease subunit [Burkholderiales bacterium]|nr:efflux RND transporter permease subunit [Burkholderiales bacterium]